MKAQDNIFVRATSGAVGNQFVVRKGRGGQTIISNKPTFNANRIFQPEQLAHQQAFKEATAYAKSAKNNPLYVALAAGTTMTSYNVAVADWFKKPIVHEINANGWNGEMGKVICVKAQDDIHVAEVKVTITDPEGEIMEQGIATQADGLWWTYTTTTAISAESESRLIATAKNLAGNTAEMTWQD